MDKLTTLLAFLVTLSLATERITEVIKGLPFLAKWLTKENSNEHLEAIRKAAVQILAIVIGTSLAAQVPDAIAAMMSVKPENLSGPTFLLFGALASGGSGFWNATLDIVREVKKQKENLTKKG